MAIHLRLHPCVCICKCLFVCLRAHVHAGCTVVYNTEACSMPYFSPSVVLFSILIVPRREMQSQQLRPSRSTNRRWQRWCVRATEEVWPASEQRSLCQGTLWKYQVCSPSSPSPPQPLRFTFKHFSAHVFSLFL